MVIVFTALLISPPLLILCLGTAFFTSGLCLLDSQHPLALYPSFFPPGLDLPATGPLPRRPHTVSEVALRGAHPRSRRSQPQARKEAWREVFPNS